MRSAPAKICRVVAERRPAGADAGDGEGRVEREAGLDGGTRLVKSAKPRESGGQLKPCGRMISISLNRPPKPSDGLLVTAENVLRDAGVVYPDISRRIARTEAQSLSNVSLCFFGAADKNLT